jgi:hypothetical protein
MHKKLEAAGPDMVSGLRDRRTAPVGLWHRGQSFGRGSRGRGPAEDKRYFANIRSNYR